MKLNLIKLAQFFKKYYRVYSIVIYLGVIVTLISTLFFGAKVSTFSFFGKKVGDIAVICFCLSLLPGIARRLKYKHPIITALGLIRPELGRLMFVLSVYHLSVMRLIPIFKFGIFIPSLFELFGIVAFLLSLPLYLTSNPKMIAKMGKNWKKLHKAVYVIVWLVFLHLALGEINLSFWIIAPTAIAELLSLYVEYLQKRTKAATPVSLS